MSLPDEPVIYQEDPLRIAKPREVTHRHSYGKISRYFRGLAVKKLMGTRCASCNLTFLPPYADCPECWKPTEWIELPQKGRVVTFVPSVQYPGAGYKEDIKHYGEKLPTIIVYIELDGVDTKLMSWIRNCDPATVRIGMQVRARFASKKKISLTALDLWWEPFDDSASA